tara:strand:- start:272 stop:802 length:531 start_codon:yes stop_codon:yes gene_type:complete
MKKVVAILFLSLATAVVAQDAYTLTPESVLTIAGSSTVHDWTVTANTMQGNLTTTNALPAKIDFSVPVADILSERGPTMDSKMHAALKIEEHPKVSFKLIEVRGNTVLVGVLNIAGTEKEVTINVKVVATGDVFEIQGEKKILLQDFGMEPPTAMFGQIVVGDEVTVNFDLFFKKG